MNIQVAIFTTAVSNLCKCLFTRNRGINTLLSSAQKDKLKEEIKNNTEVFKRIIDLNGLSYRGNKFGAVYSLNSLHDHGNFLELQ